MRQIRWMALVALAALAALPTAAAAATINFDDVVGSNQNITNRYVAQGVTLGAIANPFPLAGVFPAPATLPAVLGGVQTWTDPFPSATSPTQVAVAMPFGGAQAGDLGILMQFAFDISFLSLVGNDMGGCQGIGDCESVTLTAYDAAGNKIGQTFSNSKLPGGFDRTFSSISMSGMRYVAFNYTDTQFGFYAIDDLTFDRAAAIPEPETCAMLLAGLGLLGFATRRRKQEAV